MSELAKVDPDLAEPDRELLQNIVRGMAITADLSRADLLLLRPRSSNTFVVLAQAQPHSIASLYDADLTNTELAGTPADVYVEALHKGRHVRIQHELRPAAHR